MLQEEFQDDPDKVNKIKEQIKNGNA